MPTLIDSPSFTANEVYEIQATDSVEGAAVGASYGGIGLSNQPHQQLANRTALLYSRQQTNVANIAALQSFAALFKGSMGANGYVEIPFADVARGQIAAIVQWGFSPNNNTSMSNDTPATVNWPIAFPNACFFALATIARSGTAAASDDEVTIQVVSLGLASGTFEYNDIAGLYTIKSSTIPGFYWIAIGF